MVKFFCGVCTKEIDTEVGVRGDAPLLVNNGMPSVERWTYSRAVESKGLIHCCSLICAKKVVEAWFKKERERLDWCAEDDRERAAV